MNPNNQTIATAFAAAVQALRNCAKTDNVLWYNRWTDRINQLEKELPRGSGFDCGTKFIESSSTEYVLVFTTSFHHMDENGYDGWTDHTVRVKPCFDADNYDITVSGKNRNEIKDYTAEQFRHVLRQPAPPYPWVNDSAT